MQKPKPMNATLRDVCVCVYQNQRTQNPEISNT